MGRVCTDPRYGGAQAQGGADPGAPGGAHPLAPGGAHPLAGLITAAAEGRFPDPDGGWRRVPPWRPGLEAVLSFTGHAVFAVAPDIPDHRLAAIGADGFGGAHDPRLITALAGPEGWIDCLDLLMAARGTGQAGVPPRLAERPDLAAHSRAAFAATIRDHPRVLGYPDPGRAALAIISRGIAGLTEVSFELEPGRRGRGGGSRLAADALTAVPAGQLAVAAVAPGNVASVRALLSAGFAPLGSVQLFRRAAQLMVAPVDNEAIRDRLHTALRDALRARHKVAMSALRSAFGGDRQRRRRPPGTGARRGQRPVKVIATTTER